MKHSICIVSIIIVIVLLLQGCITTADLKPSTFSMGCMVTDANVSTGIVNSQGSIEACKLVCSEDLPNGFKYKYEARGCLVEIDTSYKETIDGK